MSDLLERVLARYPEESFTEELLDRVAESGHGAVLAEHLLACWMRREADPLHRALAKAGLDPARLSDLVIRFLPQPEESAAPPVRLEQDTLDASLVAACMEAAADATPCLVLSTRLSGPIREMLEDSNALDALRAADDSLAPAPRSSARFFHDDGLVNREAFSENGAAWVAAAGGLAAALGRREISLPVLFLAAAQRGVLERHLRGFAPGVRLTLEGLRAQLATGSPHDEVEFRRAACSGMTLDWVEMVERVAAETGAGRIDEVALVSSLCRMETEILRTYWSVLGLDPRTAIQLISLYQDDSPPYGSEPEPVPDAERMIERLRESVVGQDEAIAQLLPIVRRWLSGWRQSGRTAGTALFLGPPGVGKTELSKELAGLLYGDRNRLCFIEMNQLSKSWGVSSLIGSPVGYVGSDSGKLTDWIDKNPESIVLLDEIEKASGEVYDVMLRLLSEGVISDAAGKEYDASGILVLMTSNIGQDRGLFDRVREQRRAHPETKPENPLHDPEIKGFLLEYFRPEFVSRLNNVVLFNPLDEDAFVRIAELQLERLAEDFARRGVELKWPPDAGARIAREARLGGQGARGVRVAIDEQVLDPALRVLQKDPGTGCIDLGSMWEAPS